jgi:hypothetical protein
MDTFWPRIDLLLASLAYKLILDLHEDERLGCQEELMIVVGTRRGRKSLTDHRNAAHPPRSVQQRPGQEFCPFVRRKADVMYVVEKHIMQAAPM